MSLRQLSREAGSGVLQLVAVGVAAAGGAYYVLTPHITPRGPAATVENEDVECAMIRHWEELKKKRKEISDRHEEEHQNQLAKIEKDHPGYTEHRKRCEEERERKKAIKLMQDRHAESFPNMKGKTQSWAEKRRAKAVEDAQNDDKMEKLKEKLVKEGKL